jgi:hypothetical protein
MPAKERRSRSRDPIASIPFAPATYAALKAIAREDNRSVASLVRVAVEQWLTSKDGKAMRAHIADTQRRRSEIKSLSEDLPATPKPPAASSAKAGS